ncbi:hypothetical protein ACFQ3W_01615 [Paenibacillus puldeungensis]|uniref:Uncharacterized protein n=1 Tax=Paenibacillus puldeungensis TaxID=696536 RepID=A0ABW3RS08_9BACL
MLTFAQKLEILESFPELERRNVSLGRVNFHYEQSVHDKKTVVYHLHPNGNGYVYAGLLSGYDVDDKGFVNIRDYSADQLRSLVELSIRSLSSGGSQDSEAVLEAETMNKMTSLSPGGTWIDSKGQILTLKCEDDLWYIYSGLSLEMVFDTREEAGQYLEEEGFKPQKG